MWHIPNACWQKRKLTHCKKWSNDTKRFNKSNILKSNQDDIFPLPNDLSRIRWLPCVCFFTFIHFSRSLDYAHEHDATDSPVRRGVSSLSSACKSAAKRFTLSPRLNAAHICQTRTFTRRRSSMRNPRKLLRASSENADVLTFSRVLAHHTHSCTCGSPNERKSAKLPTVWAFAGTKKQRILLLQTPTKRVN